MPTPEFAPRLNWPYVGSLLLLACGVSLLALYSARQPSTEPAAGWLLMLFAGLVPAAVGYRIMRARTLRLDGDGIRLGGRQLRWSQISAIEQVGYGLHLYAGRQKLVIAPWAYRDPAALRVQIQRALCQP